MVIGGVVIVLLGIGGFIYAKRSNPGVETPKDADSSSLNPAAQFSQAITSGKPTVCTVSKGADTMEYFVKGKMLRANITSAAGISHMINDTKYFYIWTDGQSQGTKSAVPSEAEMENLKEQAQKYQGGAPSLNSEADYQSMQQQGYAINCKEGSVQDSDFIPPEGITFQDMSELMNSVPSSLPDPTGNVDYKKLQEQYGAAVPQE